MNLGKVHEEYLDNPWPSNNAGKTALDKFNNYVKNKQSTLESEYVLSVTGEFEGVSR